MIEKKSGMKSECGGNRVRDNGVRKSGGVKSDVVMMD